MLNISKNRIKILLIMAILIIVVAFLNVKSFAYTGSPDEVTSFSDDIINTIQNHQYYTEYKYHIAYYMNWDSIDEVNVIFFDDDSIKFYTDWYNSDPAIFCDTSGLTFKKILFKTSDLTTITETESTVTDVVGSIYKLGEKYPIYSNFNIYTDSTCTDFFLRPLVGRIAPQLEEKKMKETLAQVIAILPLIIAVLVSFLGLRKALKVLSTFLHQS